MKEVKRWTDVDSSFGGVAVLLRDDESGVQLELNWYPEGSPYNSPYTPGEGLDHIGFVVEDVAEAFRELVARGAEPVVDPSHPEGWVGFVEDPDGNWIELYQSTEPKPS